MSVPMGAPATRFSLLVGWVSCIISLTSLTTTTDAFVSYPLVPHHVHRMRMRRELALEQESPSHSSVRRRDMAQQVGALYEGYGTHYIDLWCGSPPQRQTVIVDTGSSVTAFPCAGCKDCGVPKYHADVLFQQADSNTFREHQCSEGCLSSRSTCQSDQCKISMSYAEGSSWGAFEAIDSCYVGGPHETPLMVDRGEEDIDPNHASHFAFDLIFGCQTYVTGLFKTQLADGIMGMDPMNEAFWSQMFRANKMGDKQQFALCFSRPPTPERGGTEAGAMTLGGVDERLHTSDMVFSSISEQGRSGFFSVHVRRIALRDGRWGESAQSTNVNPNEGVVVLDFSETAINTGGIIVDSGTTDTYWNRQMASVFKMAFHQLSGKQHTNSPMSLTEGEFHSLPTILFQIASSDPNIGKDPYSTVGLAGSFDPDHPGDILLAVPPSHYMEYDEKSRKYTSRFYITESGGSVLGANAMMGHDVLFDVDNHRIGWAESDCDYTNLVTGAGYDFAITGQLQEPSPIVDGTIDTTTGELDGDTTTDTTGGLDGDTTDGTGVTITDATPIQPTGATGQITGGIDYQPTTGTAQDTNLPSEITRPPVVTEPPVVVTEPPVVVTEPPIVVTQPPVVVTQPPVVVTQPPVVETDPPVVDTEPPVVVTQPPVVETEPPVVDTQPPVVVTQPPVVVTQPPVVVTQPPVVDTSKGSTETNVQPSGTTADSGDDNGDQGLWQKIQDIAKEVYSELKEALDTFLEVCDTPECRYPVGIGIVAALFMGFCCSYCFSCCCCCFRRRRNDESRGKYQRASSTSSVEEVEMTGSDKFSSYQDDPEMSSNGTGSSFSDEPEERKGGMNFRMKPEKSRRSKKPEFDGDFL